MTQSDRRALAKAVQVLERELQIAEQKLSGLFYQLGKATMEQRRHSSRTPAVKEKT